MTAAQLRAAVARGYATAKDYLDQVSQLRYKIREGLK